MSIRRFNSADGKYYEYRIVGEEPTSYAATGGVPLTDVIMVEVMNEDGDLKYFVFKGISPVYAVTCAQMLPWEDLLKRDSHRMFKYTRSYGPL